MKIRVSLSKDGKEITTKTGEVSKQGDLGALVEETFQEARAKNLSPLWDCEIQVREA